MKRVAIATLVAALVALAGCIHVHEPAHTRRGPPPHAPAHGYRHHDHDVDLRYDVHLDVYVVIGHPDHFFHDRHYYRRIGSHWERCGSWKKANWKRVEVAVVPVTLAKHYKVRRHHHAGRDHGPGPAKRGD